MREHHEMTDVCVLSWGDTLTNHKPLCTACTVKTLMSTYAALINKAKKKKKALMGFLVTLIQDRVAEVLLALGGAQCFGYRRCLQTAMRAWSSGVSEKKLP